MIGPDRIVYVNGAYLPADQASVSVFDRGFLFGDGVYEVSAVLDGKLIDNAAHLARFGRSLDALSMPRPASDEEIVEIQRELVRRNALKTGLVYLQTTRGVAERSFDFPDSAATPPSFVMFTQDKDVLGEGLGHVGLRVGLVEDLRWKRRDIKTVNLLPASWAKEIARRAGYDDAWMVEDGRITEGSSNNAFIVTHDGRIRTRALGPQILAGITRGAVLRLAGELALKVDETAFTPQEAKAACEAFITSATSFVKPVVAIDGAPIGDGAPGPISARLREVYLEMAIATAT